MHLAQPPESFGDDFDSRTNILQMTSVSPNVYDPLGDVFGTEPESPIHSSGVPITHGNPDISLDTRRLQAQHNTVGYREGITAGKASSIQSGFDQGFVLGANIGIRAGQILGLLEGISAALVESDKSVRAYGLLSQATAELNPESLFTSEFWAPDGTWTYPVTAADEDSEIVYPDVADQHPILTKWSRIVCDEAERWQIDPALAILLGHKPSVQDDARPPPETSSKPEVTSRDAIEW
ncbi:hypothetical protein GQX73_g10353 [Xylaria multiplex]|uniref:Protein YAE1 n=1 Tax=Xylaria multiplex TaxID=323545 RepID=A0A7C8IGZ6_9PEZI|nr:hypothetical protein GQX73_g10353 [Xylaria multiplex]